MCNLPEYFEFIHHYFLILSIPEKGILGNAILFLLFLSFVFVSCLTFIA